MSRHAPSIKLLPRQREILERLSRSRTLERRLAERVEMVLGVAKGRTSVETADDLGVDVQRVARWRSRFAAAQDQLAAVTTDDVSDDKLEAAMVDILSDRQRSGSPGKFTAEQLTQLVALACQEPKELGLPVTHWTPRELAACAKEHKIVESISPRHVARFFGGGRSAPAPVALLAQPQDRRPRGARGRGRPGLRDIPPSG
jgi:putative transposase